jgi:cell division protein FtsZ
MLFDLPKQESSIIKVIGVGGGGNNAVNHMFEHGIKGVDFANCNTDQQALESSKVNFKIQLGPHLTEGRGAGSKPEIGKQACIESIDDVRNILNDGTKMLFITAGMGGGTGTGAAPIIAKAAKELDILTVAIVTLPFKFEGLRRQRQALEGLEELKRNVDSILVISNDKLREIHGNLALSEAFAEADNILTTAAKGIAEIITVPGYINVDFEDVNTVMRDSGVAIMGSSIVEGDNRAIKAIDGALNSPLLEENDIRGAQHILLNITSGTREVTMDEIGEITEFVQEEAGYGTDLIWGNCKDESLGDKISITLIATGFEEGGTKKQHKDKNKVFISLEETFDLNEEHGVAKGHDEGVAAQTFDFDDTDLKQTIESLSQKRAKVPANEYVTSEPEIKVVDEDKKKQIEMESARREYLRKNNSKPLDNPKMINDLESVPAYKRRNVVLDNVEHSSEGGLSTYSITGDEESPLQGNNQFLHDNVD